MTIERPSTPALFADALAQMTSLFETEIRLVRTEISEKISGAIRAVVGIAAAAVLLLAGLFVVLFGIVQLVIFFGVVPWLAYFAVGGSFAVVGGLALVLSIRALSVDRLMPKRSLTQFGKDADVVKEQVQ